MYPSFPPLTEPIVIENVLKCLENFSKFRFPRNCIISRKYTDFYYLNAICNFIVVMIQPREPHKNMFKKNKKNYALHNIFKLIKNGIKLILKVSLISWENMFLFCRYSVVSEQRRVLLTCRRLWPPTLTASTVQR